MQVTETLSEGLKRGFTVVVPAADIETRRTARLTDLGKTLRLPGFRPGKVPLPIVRQRYGTAVTAEVLEESVNQATAGGADRAQAAAGADAEDRPGQHGYWRRVREGPGVQASNWRLLPDIALPDFSQISLIRRKAEVAPETIDKALADIAARNRTLVEITPEELAARTETPGAAEGRGADVDFVGKIDGVPFPNGAGNDIDVEVGGTGFIPGFADQLEGMQPGESRTISVTFPEDYGNKDLAGKAATFDITAKKLSRAGGAGGGRRAGQEVGVRGPRRAAEAMMRRPHPARVRRAVPGAAEARIARRAGGAGQFEAPQGMVDQEFDQIWQRSGGRAQGGHGSTRTTRTRTRRRCGPNTAPSPSGGSGWAWCWPRSAGQTASP